jgi:hypothetical protein
VLNNVLQLNRFHCNILPGQQNAISQQRHPIPDRLLRSQPGQLGQIVLLT